MLQRLSKCIFLMMFLFVSHLQAQIINTVPSTIGQLDAPNGVALDSAGNIYIADTGNELIREVVSATQVITTIGGIGIPGYTGDGGLAILAELNTPSGVAADNGGNVYIADTTNQVIRRIDISGAITTFAGTGLTPGYSGDGGLATAAELQSPQGVALDSAGNLYIADTGNNVIRRVDTSGIITTVAGLGVPGYSGDGNFAILAELDTPLSVAVDSTGNIYIADTNNSVIRRVDTNGVITTFAGIGLNPGYTGDGGLATGAQLDNPSGVDVDNLGNVYIADTFNNVIRRVNAAGIITTVAGNGSLGYSGDGGLATSAELSGPIGVAIGSNNTLYIADTGNDVIRFITFGPAVTGLTPASGPTSGGTAVTITGEFFQPGSTVTFGGVPATSVTFVNSTTLIAITPANVAAAVTVIVTDPSGLSSTIINGFTYTGDSTIAPLPPILLYGVQKIKRHCHHSRAINLLTWYRPGAGTTPIFYRIYRDPQLTDLVATVPNRRRLCFRDSHIRRGVAYTYYVVSVDAFGAQSAPAIFTVEPKTRKRRSNKQNYFDRINQIILPFQQNIIR